MAWHPKCVKRLKTAQQWLRYANLEKARDRWAGAGRPTSQFVCRLFIARKMNTCAKGRK